MIVFTFNKAQMEKVKKLATDLKGLPRRFMVNAAAVAQGEIQRNLTGRILHVRTNRLRSSVSSLVTGEFGDDSLQAAIGSGANPATSGRVPYAGIHVKGGVINRVSSKGRRYTIRIPQRDYLTPAGNYTTSKFDSILAASVKDIVK